jgi:hypothetical protein
MIDLRDRLQELADAATRDGVTPGAAAAVRRGRRRRRRIVSGVASLLLVAVAVSAVGTGQLGNQPPRPATPATTPPPAPDLQVRTGKPRPGSLEEKAFRQLTSELRRCPGGSSVPADLIGSVWSERYQRLWMVAAKQPPAQGTRFCWTSGLFDATGNGSRWGARRVVSRTAPLTSLGGGYEGGLWEIEGRVSKEVTRLQLRFRDGRAPMALAVVGAGDRYPVNFYVGLFSQPQTSFERKGWAADTLTAVGAAGRTVTSCRVGWSPHGVRTPKCPQN